MTNFIAKRIEKPETLEQRQEKYREYFINTFVYERYREAVDEKLTADGYGDCIVEVQTDGAD